MNPGEGKFDVFIAVVSLILAALYIAVSKGWIGG